MNLLNAMRDFLRRRIAPPPSNLRNKPGGLARVRFTSDNGDGSYAMQGCYVTTVRLDKDRFWVIDPPLHFTARVFMLTSSGRIACPGDPAIVESMHDDLLEPIREVGDGEQDESLRYLPPVPRETAAPKRVAA